MEKVCLGKIINTRGLKGEIKVESSTSFADIRYKEGNKILIYDPSNNSQNEYKVLHHSKVGSFDYVTLGGIDNVEKANELRGCEVLVNTDSLQKLDNGYYFYQLIGMSVVDEKGNKLGTIINCEEYPKHIILRIKGSKEFLVPFVKEFIKSVDIDKKEMIINNMEGLI